MPFALRYARYGDPGDVLELADLETGEPAGNEVVVSVLAVPVHIKDLFFMAGREGFRLPLPAVPGNQAFGRVVAVGRLVDHVAPGDFAHVLHLDPWRNPLQPGTWRRVTRVPADSVFRSFSGADPAAQGLVTSIVVSAWFLVQEALAAGGGWLIQNAGSSSCGRLVTQFAARQRLRTISLVRRAASREPLRALGADAVLLDDDAAPDAVRRITGGELPVLALDAVGGRSAATLTRCLADHGTLLTYGMTGGEPALLPYDRLLVHDIRHRGFLIDRVLEALALPDRRRLITELSMLVAQGVVRPAVAATYGLDQHGEALRHAQASGTARDGKVMIAPNAA